MRKAILAVILICLVALTLQAAEKTDRTASNEVSFTSLFHSSSVDIIDNNLQDNTPELGILAGGRSGGNSLFQTGLGLLIAGLVCGVVGGILIGAGYAIIYVGVLSSVYGMSALSTFDILALVSVMGQQVYTAVALIALGAIVTTFSILWIPGMIMMIVAAAKGSSQRLTHLNDNIGFGIRL